MNHVSITLAIGALVLLAFAYFLYEAGPLITGTDDKSKNYQSYAYWGKFVLAAAAAGALFLAYTFNKAPADMLTQAENV